MNVQRNGEHVSGDFLFHMWLNVWQTADLHVNFFFAGATSQAARSGRSRTGQWAKCPFTTSSSWCRTTRTPPPKTQAFRSTGAHACWGVIMEMRVPSILSVVDFFMPIWWFACLSVQLYIKGTVDFIEGFLPLLAWVAWQLQHSPTAWETLRNYFIKPTIQVPVLYSKIDRKTQTLRLLLKKIWEKTFCV